MLRTMVLLSLLTAAIAPAHSALQLTRAGAPVATLVIPDEALPVVKAAAEELQYHVARASGATLPIVREADCRTGTGLLFLGPCKATLALGLKLDQLRPNGYLARSAAGNLHLIGDDSPGDVFWVQHGNRTHVGTLFAVYDLLEKQLGVRWLWPGPLGEVIPRQADIAATFADQAFAPPFVHARWREGGAAMSGPKGWADQKNRSVFLNEQGKWLRRHRFAMGVNMDMAHAYTQWWDKYHADHPEYFNLLPDGTRRSDPTYHGGSPSLISMCVSNPGFIRQKIADWAARRSPDRPHVDASENDTPGRCTCPQCLALDEPDPDSKVPFDQRAAEATRRFEAGDPQWVEALGSLSDRYARTYLALQAEAQKVDPEAIVMGYAYANYVKPPHRTMLNDHIIIGVVPALMYPWTAEKRQAFIEQWNGWSATGARMFLRPNYMLDGHNLPLNIAQALGEDFQFAAKHGLIGTDFDSLTGQYATQGPNLYMLARLHDDPGLEPPKVLAEYYSAFGKAAPAVQAYFEHWARVSAGVTDKAYEAADLHWSRLYRDADVIFMPDVMMKGRALLEKATMAARGDADAETRVTFLDSGLRNAELTLATQRAFREYRQTGKLDDYVAALAALDEFRAAHEGEFIANMAYLAWSESLTWDRDLIRLMAQPGQCLPDPWKFMWDPQKIGEAERWFAVGFADDKWHAINTTAAWENQEIGKQWKAEHKADYDGLAWYRTTFTVPRSDKPRQVRLVFGAADEACKVWLNSELILQRPYPFQGNTDSWRESFEVDITDRARADGPNVLAVCVEDNAGAGGLWKPVWLCASDAPSAANLVKDGGFEAEPTTWGQNVQSGKFRFERDAGKHRTGQTAGLIGCQELGSAEDEKRARTKAWGRWYRGDTPVEAGKSYALRVWYLTDADFRGTVRVWATGAAEGTKEVKGLSTQGVWRELRIEHIKPAGTTMGLYLNVMDGTGKVWFDDVEVVAE
ncbi:DUF4838 domain-containing protein [bacterium]|nr:DUF4838 domain-containing protein [bacterium]